MNPRADYLIQILEKIGSPLMGAVIESQGAQNGEASANSDAQSIAALLGKTVQVSIDMANATDLSKAGEQDDSMRVALAALAAPMIADYFKSKGQIPSEARLKKIIAALQTVLTFSENFSPSPENTERLKNIAASAKPVDAHQVNIQYIHAFIPVINAAGAFAFGQSEQKLVMGISSRLVAKAAGLSRALLGELSEEEQKLTEVGLLRSLAEIYAQCHNAETKRLGTMSDEERAAQTPNSANPIDNVWTQFDLRVAMLEAMAENSLPAGKASNGSKAPTIPLPVDSEAKMPETAVPPENIPPPPPTPPTAPLEVPEEQTAPAQQPNTPPPPAQEQSPPTTPVTEQQSAPQTANNPMSMFAKPKSDGSAAPDTSAQAQPQPETPAQEPVAPAPPQQEAAPTPDQPTEAPKIIPEQSPKDDASEASAGGPMSFFKTPPKNSDES